MQELRRTFSYVSQAMFYGLTVLFTENVCPTKFTFAAKQQLYIFCTDDAHLGTIKAQLTHNLCTV